MEDRTRGRFRVFRAHKARKVAIACILIFVGVAAIFVVPATARTQSPAGNSALAAMLTGPRVGNQPLEGGTPRPAGTFQVGPPSARVSNDPHWRSPNVRANTDSTQYAQQEPAIAVNPLNPLNVVAAQKDERSAPGQGTSTKEVWIDTSTDGGVTWPVNVHIPMPDSTQPNQSDPVITFSNDNSVYVTVIGLNVNVDPAAAAMIAKSTDGGLTWPTPAYRITGSIGYTDKEWTAIDLNPSSPYYHRMYTTWRDFSGLGATILEKWSSDGGVTWNPNTPDGYVQVSYGAYNNGQFAMPVVLNNGDVLVTWSAGSGALAVARSTDGGQTFISPNTLAATMNYVNDVPGSLWRLNTIPATAVSPATGTVVSVWADGRNGKDDIYFTRSTDNGATWSAPARVPHNAAGSSYQVEPWVSAAPNGRFDAIWYDDRDFPSSLNTFHIYASHSTDDGATWTGPDEQVTDASSDLNIGIPQGAGWNGAAGDYIGVTSANSVAYGIWTDTRSATNEDVYTSSYQPGPPTSPTPTSTAPTSTPTSTQTSTPSGTPTGTSTGTPVPSSTATVQETGTATPTTPEPSTTTVPTETSTASPVASATPGSPTVTSTPCTISFTDVHPTDYFYNDVKCVYCLGAVSGYSDGTFRPFANTTRGQMTKIIVLALRIPLYTPTAGSTFNDVPRGSTFFDYVETAAHNQIVSGYSDGTFRPDALVTRGQLSKIDAVAANHVYGWPLLDPPTNTFTDVPRENPFYTYIETVACHGVVSGYSDGTFRWGANAIRAQIAKIVCKTSQNPPQCTTAPTASSGTPK